MTAAILNNARVASLTDKRKSRKNDVANCHLCHRRNENDGTVVVVMSRKEWVVGHRRLCGRSNFLIQPATMTVPILNNEQ